MNTEIFRKKIKNLYLNITSQGGIKVSAPMKMPLSEIYAFIESKSTWIKRQQEKLRKHEQTPKKTYNNGETHYFKGKPYQLKLIDYTKKPMIQLSDTDLILYIHPQSDNLKKQLVLEHWYAAQLKIMTQDLVNQWQVKMHVCVKQIKIRKMKTRWGSCSPHTQSIRINLELAKRPFECLEYIIVHELTHLLEPSHNKRFVRFMDQFLPDWKASKKLLNSAQISS